MSGARRCCCTGAVDPPTTECGCDGPIYVSVNGANASWSIVICEATPNSCVGENWAGKGVEWNIESRFWDLRFECVPSPSVPDYWEITPYADHPVQFTFAVALTGDDFEFDADGFASETCTETWTPAGSMDLTFVTDDLPDGVTIEKWVGTIRNEPVFGFGDRAVMRLDIRIRIADRFDDLTSLIVNPFTFKREVIPRNPQLEFHITAILVADKVFGPDDCPTDLVWNAHPTGFLVFYLYGTPLGQAYASYPRDENSLNNGTWVVPPDLGPDCETLCDTFPYPTEEWGCGGALTSWLDLMTGSYTNLFTTGIRYASWDSPSLTVLDYETAPPLPP